MTAHIVYLNGEFLPLEQARISVLDRGFIYADGVYEVIPCYGGRLFRLPQHLERLQHSLDGIRLANPLSIAQWQTLLEQLVQHNGSGDLSVYLQITRGVAPRDHAFPANTSATVFMMATPLSPVAEDIKRTGVATVTLDDIRWRHCDIKSIALLANVLARQQALDSGAAEAILVRDGLVTEGAASNVFVVRNGVILTPPKGPYLLPGITRDLILELATANDLPAREANITVSDLNGAEEIWLTSSTREVLPVTRLNDAPVGTSQPGPLWARMLALFQAYKRDFAAGRVE